MKQRKKKKGSTLIIVVIVMAIIFTTGTTILAVTASDYKMRINEGRKLQNLYEADSGLDIVENIIIKTSQEAVKYADKEVKKEFSELDKEDRAEDEINKLFKEKFYDFFLEEKEVKNSDKTVENVKILKYLISTKQIITAEENKVLVLENVDENKNFSIEILEYKEDEVEKDRITIEVQSTFETKNSELKNKKTVSTKYEVFAPEYKSQISSINIYPVFDGKAITADGNMNVKGSGDNSSINISGDIWIKGNNDLGSDPEYTFEKYKGGINLESTKFNINGNIYTANTFHLKNKVKDASINGDIYAKNIYVGKEVNSTISDSNNISFEKNVIVNNDLALNATNSKVLIKKDFYGINEKTADVTTANKALNSSSIIVNDTTQNENKEYKLEVEGNSYIMGVAYLNATDKDGNKYQTGESVAVKGNYLAYTDVDDVLNGGSNVTLKYYNPLQLLEIKDGKDDVPMKAKHFEEYYNDDNQDGKHTFYDGGVQLIGEVKSVGASVKYTNNSNDKVQGVNINLDDDIKIVNEQRNEFARNVFAMGDATGLGDNLYEGQKVQRTVSDQINFANFEEIKLKSIKEDNGVVILKGNNEKRENIEIKDNEINGQVVSKGLIITNGDITIEGSFNFTGNIITTGNIKFEGEGQKTITYDPQVVRSILSLNYESLKDIFEPSASKGEEIRVSSISDLYSTEKFLKKSLWRIVK